MSTPRYLAAHWLLPALVRERGALALLDAMERGDTECFAPVWMQAGFRFSPRCVHRAGTGLRVGVLSLPRPREPTEGFLAALSVPATDPASWRYFLLELAEPDDGGLGRTVIGEWAGSTHRNFGGGPRFSGDWAADTDAFIRCVQGLCR